MTVLACWALPLLKTTKLEIKENANETTTGGCVLLDYKIFLCALEMRSWRGFKLCIEA